MPSAPNARASRPSSRRTLPGLPVVAAPIFIVNVAVSILYVVVVDDSVDDEEAGTDNGARSMRYFAIGDLVAHPGSEDKDASVAELGDQFTFQAVHHVALRTPVIGDVPRRVVNDSDSKVTVLKRPPERRAKLAAMLRGGYISPIGRLERNIRQLHRLSPVTKASF